MIPGIFEYHRPRSVGEAVGLLAALGDESRVMAGGHSLLPMMKLRLAAPEHVIDLRNVEELRGISIEGGAVTIGAMVTQHEIIGSGALAAACPLLRETALQIADPQVRYCGTVGGNLANGDAGNDLPAAMQALDADYVLVGAERPPARRLPRLLPRAVRHRARGRRDPERGRVRRPAPAPRRRVLQAEAQDRRLRDRRRRGGARPLRRDMRERGGIATNVGDTTLFAEEAGAILTGSRLDADTIARASEAAKAIAQPGEDPRGPPDYRRHIAGVMVRRAVEAARDRALEVTDA